MKLGRKVWSPLRPVFLVVALMYSRPGVITLMPHGIKFGRPGMGGAREKKRGEIMGWSIGATRRNMAFLMSVVPERLEGRFAFVYTLTVKGVPPSAEAFRHLIKKLRDRLAYMGAELDHWVIEWTRVGRPHLHGVVFLRQDVDPLEASFTPNRVVDAWLDLTADLGTLRQAQMVAPLTAFGGWAAYVSKHSGRGVGHYQRQRPTLPPGWLKTGRLWAKSKGWPVDEKRIEVCQDEFHWFRRRIRSFMVAQARAKMLHANRFSDENDKRKHRRSLKAARGFLRNSDRFRSDVRGGQEWVPEVITARLAGLMASEFGFEQQPSRLPQYDPPRIRP